MMFEKIKLFIASLPPEYIFGIFVATLLAIPYFLNYINNHLKVEKEYIMNNLLTNEESICSFQKEIKGKLNFSPSLYSLLLEDILNFLNKLLGPLKFFSYKAFDKHLLFSLIYSFALFILVWSFGGSGKIGTVTILSNENRVQNFILIFLTSIVIYFLFINLKKIQNFNNRMFKKIFSFSQLLNNDPLEKNLPFIAILAGSVAIALQGIENNNNFELAFGIIVGIVSVFAIKKLVKPIRTVEILELIISLFTLMLLAIVWLIGGVNHINPTVIIYLFFFFILPFFNAIFDHISMFFSRYFANKILKTVSKLKIFFDLFLDLLIAIILLIGLAWTLYHIVELANIYLIKNKELYIPINQYKEQLISNPFQKDILWITLMFISTLLPTLFHILIAFYSFIAFILVKPHLHMLVQELNTLNLQNNHKKEIVAKGLAQYRLSKMIKIYIIAFMILIVASLITFIMLLIKIGFHIF